jgi:hypothetical protein
VRTVARVVKPEGGGQSCAVGGADCVRVCVRGRGTYLAGWVVPPSLVGAGNLVSLPGYPRVLVFAGGGGPQVSPFQRLPGSRPQ